jgi:hypothetical protein
MLLGITDEDGREHLDGSRIDFIQQLLRLVVHLL